MKPGGGGGGCFSTPSTPPKSALACTIAISHLFARSFNCSSFTYKTERIWYIHKENITTNLYYMQKQWSQSSMLHRLGISCVYTVHNLASTDKLLFALALLHKLLLTGVGIIPINKTIILFVLTELLSPRTTCGYCKLYRDQLSLYMDAYAC